MTSPFGFGVGMDRGLHDDPFHRLYIQITHLFIACLCCRPLLASRRRTYSGLHPRQRRLHLERCPQRRRRGSDSVPPPQEEPSAHPLLLPRRGSDSALDPPRLPSSGPLPAPLPRSAPQPRPPPCLGPQPQPLPCLGPQQPPLPYSVPQRRDPAHPCLAAQQRRPLGHRPLRACLGQPSAQLVRPMYNPVQTPMQGHAVHTAMPRPMLHALYIIC